MIDNDVFDALDMHLYSWKRAFVKRTNFVVFMQNGSAEGINDETSVVIILLY